MNQSQIQEIYQLLGDELFYKCENFIGITPSEISERVKYLNTVKKMTTITPQILIQKCRLNGERTLSKINRLKKNVPIIIERLKRRDFRSTEDVGRYMDEINTLLNSPFFRTLSQTEKLFFVNLQRDLLSNIRRIDRDSYLNPGFEWKTISRL